jgi:hypothetical protein
MDIIKLLIVILTWIGMILFLLTFQACSYDTKVKCDYEHHYAMKMTKLIEKCNYIEYGDTWVKKDI